MISLIIVTDPDVTLAKAHFLARLINTLNGCVVACCLAWNFCRC